MANGNKKPMTIDDLAEMVAEGFANTATKQDVSAIQQDINGVKQDLSEVKHEVLAVKSNLNNYLELSERRYVELKQRDALLAQWIKLVAEKTGVPVDVSQLEKI
jgi:hypothetical protein